MTRHSVYYESEGADRATRRANRRSSYDVPGKPPVSAIEGESGTGRGRRLRVDTHRATTRVLRVAYPFLAEGGLGADGTYIGSDVFSGGSFVYDPWVLYQGRVITNPNVLLAGVIGSGKSSTAKALITRSLALGHKAYVPCDPKGEWTAVAEAMGGATIKLGPGLATRLNPLDAGRKPATVQRRRVAADRLVSPPSPAGHAGRVHARPSACCCGTHRAGPSSRHRVQSGRFADDP